MGMRTTLDLPDDLLEKARQAVNARTKRDTVVAGLEELIRRRHHQDLIDLAGRIHLDIDLKRSRKR